MRYEITGHGDHYAGFVEDLHEQGMHGSDCVFCDREWARAGHPEKWNRDGWTVELGPAVLP